MPSLHRSAKVIHLILIVTLLASALLPAFAVDAAYEYATGDSVTPNPYELALDQTDVATPFLQTPDTTLTQFVPQPNMGWQSPLQSRRVQNQSNAHDLPFDSFTNSILEPQTNGSTLDPLSLLPSIARADMSQSVTLPSGTTTRTTQDVGAIPLQRIIVATPQPVKPVIVDDTAPTGSGQVLNSTQRTLTSSDGNVQLVFSPNALPVEEAIGFVEPFVPLNIPPSLETTGLTFQLVVQDQSTEAWISTFLTEYRPPSPADVVNQEPTFQYEAIPAIRAEITYDVGRQTSGDAHLYRYRADIGAWQWVPSYIDTNRGVLHAVLNQAGYYAVLTSPQDNSTPSKLLPPSDYTILLDPDHGGGLPDQGHVYYPPEYAADEAPYNLVVANLVRDRLLECGVNVEMTRTGDDAVPYEFRTIMVNTGNYDAAITLAFNTSDGTMSFPPFAGTGPEALINPTSTTQASFGTIVNGRVEEYTGLPSRGLKNRLDIYMIANVDPALNYTHAELAFMDSYVDRAYMDTNMAAFANAVTAGVLDTLGGTEQVCQPGFELPPPLSAEERARLRMLGYQNWMRYRGDPVNTSTGNSIHQFTDLAVPGVGMDFVFQRTYNGLDSHNAIEGRESLFGMGWSSLLDMDLRFANDGSVDVRLADGSGVYFEPTLDGGYEAAQGGVYWTLAASGPDFVLMDKAQIAYLFNADGQLLMVRDRFDNTIELVRDGEGVITAIVDTAGRQYPLTYQGDSIATLGDPAGRTITYAYTGDDLTSVTDANGGITQFEYDNHLMTRLIDPEGIVYLENEYDADGRVVSQQDGTGNEDFFDYTTPDQTNFIDNRGNATNDQYDALGRVTTVADALNQNELFAYDTDYNVVSYTDGEGENWVFTYDERGNVLSSTDPLGNVVTYTYNNRNDVTSITDEGGVNGAARTTTYVYDSAGNLVQIVRPDGTTITSTYDVHGQMLTMSDPLGHTTLYEYNANGDVIEITDALGFQTLFQYDVVGRNHTLTDANGHTVTFAYDNNDNLLTLTDPLSEQTRMDYDGNDNLVQVTDRRGGVTLYEYDDNLKLIRETDAEGHVIGYGYDALYNRITMTDQRGNITRYRYDELNRLNEVENADGGITKFAYDANGNPVTLIDALNQTTSFEYDALSRQTKVTDALGGVTTITYDAVGRRTSVTNPRGAITTFTFDLLDRMVQVTDALGGVWETTFDPNGNVIAETDANGHTRTMAYDDINRITSLTDAEGHTTHLTYDNVGNVLRVTDALGRVTSYTYDAKDNLSTTTDALSGVTQLSYDEEDNLVAFTDQNSHTTTFVYDLNGLRSQITEAGGQVTTLTYDPARNLLTMTNAKGNTWTYTYDGMNRQVSAIDPLNHTTSYAFDLLGRVIRMTDANGVATRYDYDGLDRLTAVVQNEQSGQPPLVYVNVTTTYQYDSVGNLIALLDANGEQTDFSYDLLDRLVGEVNPLGNVWVYEYDPVGNMTDRVDAKGQRTLYTYTADNFPATVVYPDGTGIEYEYDAVNNETSMTDSLGVTVNDYDALNRLTRTTNHLGQAVTYTYDAVGNRRTVGYPDGKTVQYEYDPTNFVNRIIDPEGFTYAVTRDATHNATLIAYPNATSATYTFDAAERLMNVTNQQQGGAILSAFDYTLDAVGNRTRAEGEYAWRQPRTLDYDYEYDPLYRLTRSEDNEGRFTTYQFDAAGNRTQMVTNYDPTLNRKVDTATTTYSFNGANQLLTALKELTPTGNPRPDRARQTSQAVQALVHEIKAQRGHHITPATADSLLASANALLNDLAANRPPTVAQVETRLNALKAAITTAQNNGTIDNAGVANSLRAKLDHAKAANRQQGGELSATTYRYDANGNRIEVLSPDDGTSNDRDWLRTNYAYDFENRLVHAANFRNSGNGNWLPNDETRLTFDGYGRLFQRLHDQHQGGGGQKWRTYAYDGLDPIAEYLTPSNQYVHYYRGLGRILHMDDQPASGGIGSLYYFHHDGLNSVSAISKHQGQSAHNYRYSDYGTILDNNDHAADASNFTNPHNHYTYTGQEWDEYNELFHFYAREYDPSTGTWLQQDPYRGEPEIPISLHRYQHVSNNPPTNIDLYGYIAWDVTFDIAMAAWGAYDLYQEPSWENAGWFALDVVGLLPIVPNFGKALKYGPKVLSLGNKIENLGDVARVIDDVKDTSNVVDNSKDAHNVAQDATEVVSNNRNTVRDLQRVTDTNGVRRYLVPNSPWTLHPFARGNKIESILAPRGYIGGNYPVIDAFDNGSAISIKSIDLDAPSYQNVNTLTRTIQGYVDDLANWQGADWTGIRITENMITSREVILAIPPRTLSSNSSQMATLYRIQQEAASKGVTLKIMEVP